MSQLQEILAAALEKGASDTHIIAGLPPLFRIHTQLGPIEQFGTVSAEQADQFVREMVSPDRYEQFGVKRDLDFSTKMPDMGRFRVNAHFQRNTVAIAFRVIPNQVPSLEALNLPPIVNSFADLPRGLVLVTGPTGSGKSTTLASMIDAMNQRHSHHIITLEDPVEYELRGNQCVIEQREVGSDVTSFASGLRHALRQDPDIILVGEMRDLATTSAAISAAETGHLVLSTLHTQGASQTIERIIDIYPPEQQNQIRSMLATTLHAVISMALFNRRDQKGMIPACEVMVCNPAVRNCIRENRIHEIPNIIATNRKIGMCLFDESLRGLVRSGRISPQQAIASAVRPDSLANALGAGR
ncbi:MAG: PilT/PilU family type 4a pilus ATPase [Phycisphaerae bacterium]|nr:PilT/PilU family type 4a pilus ATPase [Phycisphaerae bacterium]